MHRTKQVVDSLDRIEGQQINVHKYGVPVGHRAIPKARQLEGLQLLAVLRLEGNEAGLRVNELEKVERLAILVLHSAYEINGIEMGTLLEHGHIVGIVLVNLARLENLELIGSIGRLGDEWTATWLTHILHHTADAKRTIELVLDVKGKFGVVKLLGVGILDEEVLLEEVEHIHQMLVLVLATFQNLKVREDLLLEAYKNATDDLLVGDGRALLLLGNHVVDVLDEDHVGILLIQVLDKSTMSTGTEKEIALLVAEWRVVHIGSQRIGAGFLYRERDLILHAIAHLVGSLLLFYESFEEWKVIGADREMQLHLSLSIGSIEGAFFQMLLESLAHALRRAVEGQETLRKLSVVETLWKKKVGYNRLVLTGSNEVINAFSFVLDTGFVQFGIEGELLDARKELLLEIGGRHIVVSVQELEEILEHTACCTGGRDKLQNLVVCLQILLPKVLIILGSIVINNKDAIIGGGCTFELQIGEARFK